MCRIVGIVNFEPHQDIKNILVSMRDVMSHGGPDDAGMIIDQDYRVALGNRRLSIIDTSDLGHQPMSNEDKTLWITYNGEIYNFPQLKNELKSLGHSFRSHSDTEVILKAYEEWGEQAFEKFIGMFAFCLFDKRNKALYLVRDHAGIKPLYYCVKDGMMIFASETRSFRVYDPAWPENYDWRTLFLLFGHMPEPYTTLHDVYMLPKGSFLRIDLSDQTYSLQSYFSFNYTHDIKDEREAETEIQNIFHRAVQRHLISDVNTGVFLSGGIDSSLVTLLASEYQGEHLKTLSVVFDDKHYSEEKYQKIVLERIKSEHKSYLVTEKDFLNNLDDIFSAMDQPTIDGINTYFISKCAKEAGYKVVLSGLGGDELFGGYPSFNRIGKLWFLRNSRMKHLTALGEYIPDTKMKKLSFLSIKEPLNYYLLFRGIFPIKKVSEILGLSRNDVTGALEKIQIDVDDDMTPKNFASFLETNLYMQNQLLRDTDFMSMWHSVEVRVPFLDKELMNYVFSVHDSLKFNSGVPKYLLVKAFEKTLPKEIVSRKKQGFTFPFQIWMKMNATRFFIDDKISLDNKPFLGMVEKFLNNKLHWSRFWALAVMRQWNSRSKAPIFN